MESLSTLTDFKLKENHPLNVISEFTNYNDVCESLLTYYLVLAFSFHIFLLKILINEHVCNISMKYEYANILLPQSLIIKPF